MVSYKNVASLSYKQNELTGKVITIKKAPSAEKGPCNIGLRKPSLFS
jgi:hypothetical protein